MPRINKYQDINDIANEAKRDLIDRHSPFIKCAETATAGEPFEVTVQVGNEYTHPDDMDHHISGVALFNGETKLAEATMFAGALGGQGKKANASVTFKVVLEKNAKLVAHAYCTKHGVWEGDFQKVEVK